MLSSLKLMIKKYFKKIIRRLLNKVSGRVMFQSFWERLYEISYIGMNFGGVDIQIGGEKEILKRLSQSINDDVIPVIFDVGANVGEYSLEVISVFGNKMKLYCFEPSKEEAFPLLVQNLKGYENVKLYNFGLGDKNETATLYSCRENSLLSSKEKSSTLSSVFLRRMDHLGTQMRYKEKIELKRLDDFCKNNAINHIHLLKLDAEGNELNILKGAKFLIDSNSIDFIQFEFSGCNIDSKTFFQDFFYLFNPNYRVHRVLKNGLAPIDIYEEKQEIFIATNYLAISRKL